MLWDVGCYGIIVRTFRDLSGTHDIGENPSEFADIPPGLVGKSYDVQLLNVDILVTHAQVLIPIGHISL